MPGIPAVRFTYEDYVLLPEEKRYEIIDGDLLMSPAPTIYHQDVIFRLARLLDDWVRARDLGKVQISPCDVYLSETDIVQPDILYVSKARLGIIEERYVRGAPDLAVEAFLEATASRDRVLKGKLYAKFGVKEYWLVDLASKSAEVLAHTGGGFERLGAFGRADALRSQILPELAIPLSQVL